MIMRIGKVVYGDNLYHDGARGWPSAKNSPHCNGSTRCGIPLCVPSDIVEIRTVGDFGDGRGPLPNPPIEELCPVCFDYMQRFRK